MVQVKLLIVKFSCFPQREREKNKISFLGEKNEILEVERERE